VVPDRLAQFREILAEFDERPAAQDAAMSEPMLDPTTPAGLRPASSSAWSTPMCANPLRPPPPRTRLNGREVVMEVR